MQRLPRRILRSKTHLQRLRSFTCHEKVPSRAIEVIDNAPLIVELDAEIEDRLRMIAPRGKAAVARELVEGWWWPRICATLQMDDVGTISIIEVEQKLDDIRDSLKRDPFRSTWSMSIHLTVTCTPSRKCGLSASFVRSAWALIDCNTRNVTTIGPLRNVPGGRDKISFSTERLADFEKTLIEEWEPRFFRMCDGLKRIAMRRRPVTQDKISITG